MLEKVLTYITFRTKLHIVVSLGLLSVSVLVAVTLVSLNTIRLEWTALQDIVENKHKHLHQIYANLGYGGAIYHFQKYVLTSQETYLADYQHSMDQVEASIKAYQTLGLLTAVEANSLRELEQLPAKYDETVSVVKQMVMEGKPAEEIITIIAVDDTPYLHALDNLVQDIDQQLAQTGQTFNTQIQQAVMRLLISIFVALALILIPGLILVRNITWSLHHIINVAKQQAAGDISQRVAYIARDEIGLLATTFNNMIDRLHQRIEAEQAATEETARLAKAEKQAIEEANRLAEAERETNEKLQKQVRSYLEFVKKVTRGDLSARLSLNGDNDSLTVLGHNLNQMVEQLGRMTEQMQQATTKITAVTAEILAASSQQAAAATEQAAAITQTTTTIEEVRAIVEQAYDKAKEVSEQAQRTRETSEAGQHAVSDTVISMEQIKEKVAGIAENILALSEQTQQISDITTTVSDIASQSNLLALNASVEAARAGEAGKGFAVVAVEVRNLAEQSKQATAQVKTILGEIQRATNAAVMATEEGTKGVDIGLQRTEQTGSTIKQLASSVGLSTSVAQQIVASTQQQTAGMEQIDLAMQNINQATLQNISSTRQVEQSVEDLSIVAQQLAVLLDQYQLN